MKIFKGSNDEKSRQNHKENTQNIDPNQSPSPAEIPPQVIKVCCVQLKISPSLDSISLTSVVVKFLEKIIRNEIIANLEINKVTKEN